MSDLRTNYTDDELAVSMEGKRKFNIVDSQGNVVYANVHIDDVSSYSNIGDEYGAAQINEQNEKINGISTHLPEITSNSTNITGTGASYIEKRVTVTNGTKTLLGVVGVNVSNFDDVEVLVGDIHDNSYRIQAYRPNGGAISTAYTKTVVCTLLWG